MVADDLPAVIEGAAQTDGTYGGTLRVAHPFPPTSLDPLTGGSGADHQVLYPLFDRLVHTTFDTLEFTPGLATSWEFTDDTTLVFELREGVMFHDGTPFNADAVAYNIDQGKNHPNSRIVSDLDSVESTEVLDEYTIQFNLSRPDSGLIGILSDRAGMMRSPTAAEAAEEQQFNASPVGTGPFKMVAGEYAEGERLLVERNEDYWQDGLPYLDSIEWSFSGDEQSALNGLRSGDIDVSLTIRDFSQVSAVDDDPALEVVSSPALHVDGCFINIDIAPFDDVRVRKAWSMAMDRDALADVFSFGLSEPAYGPVPPTHWAYDPNMEGVNGYDPEAATALLAEAGTPDVTVLLYDAPPQIRKGELLQQMAEAVGFNVELEVLEIAAAVPGMFNDKLYGMWCSPWVGRPDPGQTAAGLFRSEQRYSMRDYDVAGLDAMIDAAVATDDIDERAAAYADVWQVAVGQEALWTPLWHNPSISFTTAEVHGFQNNLLNKGQVQFAWLDQG